MKKKKIVQIFFVKFGNIFVESCVWIYYFISSSSKSILRQSTNKFMPPPLPHRSHLSLRSRLRVLSDQTWMKVHSTIPTWATRVTKPRGSTRPRSSTTPTRPEVHSTVPSAGFNSTSHHVNLPRGYQTPITPINSTYPLTHTYKKYTYIFFANYILDLESKIKNRLATCANDISVGNYFLVTYPSDFQVTLHGQSSTFYQSKKKKKIVIAWAG